jgi:chromosome segregation ATPase
VTHAETKPRTADEWASRAITAEAKLTLANAEIERLTRYHDGAQAALAAGAEKRDELEANAKDEAAINSELNRQLDCALWDIESRKVTEDMLRGRLAEAHAELAAGATEKDALRAEIEAYRVAWRRISAGAKPCDRIESHAGPCNGYPRPDCLAARETT